MRRYLRSDATPLLPEAYCDIIDTKDSTNTVYSTDVPNTSDTLRITDTSHRFNNLHIFFTNITDRACSYENLIDYQYYDQPTI
ncbi:15366_t:CDS:2 [Funneliformis caledonium]|uniref:15366_t:CDS:1 n=1 Tax=Funneliformis caledonium TaxID=1117310 RepID=A0A9N9DC68_9GLOM|nr:15366_t:CDS:2 [Funneliformis caledonium]